MSKLTPIEIWMAVETNIKERIAKGDGFWRPCSGCYETEDGQNVHGYPHSRAFGCDLGGGCSECGGIGAVWDTTDYEHMGKTLAAELQSSVGAQSEQEPVAWRWKVSPMQLNWQYSEDPPAKHPVYNLELLYAAQSPAAPANKKTRCESCNLLEACADPQCPNSLSRSSAGSDRKPLAWYVRARGSSERHLFFEERDAKKMHRELVENGWQTVLLEPLYRDEPQISGVWQPIETAPKDGTAVDLWKGVRLTDCHWSSLPYAGDIPWGWTCQNLGRITKPTHWMPLPASPLSRPQHSTGETK